MGVASAVIGGSLISGVMGSRAASKAADASRAGTDAAIAEQRRQFDLTREDTAPYRDVGQSSLYRIASMYGLPGFEGGARRLTTAEQEELATLQALSQGRAGTGSPEEITALRQRIAQQRNLAGSLGGDAPVGFADNIRAMEARLAEMQGQPAQMTDSQRQRLEYLQGLSEGGNVDPASQADPGNPVPEALRIAGMAYLDPDTDPSEVVQNLPGYQFRLGEAEKAIARQSARYRGTPRAAKELGRYVSDYSSSEFNKYLDRATSERNTALEALFRLSGIGGNAVNTATSAGMAAAGNIGQAAIAGGNAQANAAMQGGAAVNNAIQGGLSNYTTLQMYNQMMNAFKPQYAVSPSFAGVGASPY